METRVLSNSLLKQLLILALLLVVGFGNFNIDSILEVGIDSSGSSEVIEDGNNPRSVTFENRYNNQSIFLFWEDNSGGSVKMGTLPKSGQMVFTSFINHKFFATTDEEGHDRVLPNEVFNFILLHDDDC